MPEANFAGSLEWAWNAYAETYDASAKVSRKGARFFVDGEAGFGEADFGEADFGEAVERSGTTPLPKI